MEPTRFFDYFISFCVTRENGPQVFSSSVYVIPGTLDNNGHLGFVQRAIEASLKQEFQGMVSILWFRKMGEVNREEFERRYDRQDPSTNVVTFYMNEMPTILGADSLINLVRDMREGL